MYSLVVTDCAYSIGSSIPAIGANTFNAPFEIGSMSRNGEVSNRINEMLTVRPHEFFPSLIRVRNPTPALLLYVLEAFLRTDRYGATPSRHGTMRPHLRAIFTTSGPITSNLDITQRCYDILADQKQLPSDAVTPIRSDHAMAAFDQALSEAMDQALALRGQTLKGDTLVEFLNRLPREEERLRAIIALAAQDSRTYHQRFFTKPSAAAGRGKGRAKAAGDASAEE